MRRIITRLIIAQLIPVGIKMAKKLFRKNKQTAAQPHLDDVRDGQGLGAIDGE